MFCVLLPSCVSLVPTHNFPGAMFLGEEYHRSKAPISLYHFREHIRITASDTALNHLVKVKLGHLMHFKVLIFSLIYVSEGRQCVKP